MIILEKTSNFYSKEYLDYRNKLNENQTDFYLHNENDLKRLFETMVLNDSICTSLIDTRFTWQFIESDETTFLQIIISFTNKNEEIYLSDNLDKISINQREKVCKSLLEYYRVILGFWFSWADNLKDYLENIENMKNLNTLIFKPKVCNQNDCSAIFYNNNDYCGFTISLIEL